MPAPDYDDIPADEKLRLSRQKIVDRDDALKMHGADTDFPDDPVDGQKFWHITFGAFYSWNDDVEAWVREIQSPESTLVFDTIATARAAYAAEWYDTGQGMRILGSAAAGDQMPVDYKWSAASVLAHTGDAVLRPTNGYASAGANPGRWLRKTPTTASQRTLLSVYSRSEHAYTLVDIDALRAMEWTGSDRPASVLLRSWLNVGDDGGRVWLDVDDTATTDDGVTCIVDAATNRWKVDRAGRWDARRFGLVCDGDPDDYSGTDNQVALQAAINFLSALGGRHTLWFPGFARIAAAVRAKSNITLAGDNCLQAGLILKSGVNDTLIKTDGSNTDEGVNVGFKNFSLHGNAANQSGGSGFDFSHSDGVRFEDCLIRDMVGSGGIYQSTSKRFYWRGDIEGIPQGHGLSLSEADYCEVTGSFREIGYSAVNAARCNYGVLRGLLCYNQTRTTHGYGAVRLPSNTKHFSVEGGSIYGFSVGVFLLTSYYCIVNGVSMRNIDSIGVFIGQDTIGPDGMAESNIVSNCGINDYGAGNPGGDSATAILINGGNRNMVTACRAVGNASVAAYGFRCVDQSPTSPTDNSFSDNVSQGAGTAHFSLAGGTRTKDHNNVGVA